MFNSSAHYVFGTTSAFSHVTPVVGVALGLLAQDPTAHISIIIHLNNKTNADRLIKLSSTPNTDRIKLFPVGVLGSHKEIHVPYMELAHKSGAEYAAILADDSRPPPTALIYDITSFFYILVKKAVEEQFPHIKPAKLVAYNPQSSSELLHAAGAEENGSIRWLVPALLERGIDIVNKGSFSKGPTEDIASSFPTGEALAKQGKIFEEVYTASDRLSEIPGVPPLHIYEYWSVALDWTHLVNHGLVEYLAQYQSAALAPHAWITAFPSDVFEPETFQAAVTDPVLTDGGKKPFFQAGWFERPAGTLEGEVASFLDKFGPKTVVFVSFGTIVDAGKGADLLFDHLIASKTPFVFAGGAQTAHLPEAIQASIKTAVTEGVALAPDWCDQLSVLHHPSILAFVSHCGANSTVEAILAEVPIITWGKRMDQMLLSSQIGARGLGVELIQHREGAGVGKPIAHRRDIATGDPKVLLEEIKRALVQVKEDAQIRENLKVMAAEIRSRRGGVWAENVAKFIEWVKAD